MSRSRVFTRLSSFPLGVLAALAVASPAAAAPPWSPAAEVPGAPDAFPALDFSRTGSGLVYWSAEGSRVGGSTASGIGGAVLGNADSFQPAHAIAARVGGDVLVYGRDRTAVVARPSPAALGAPLRVAFGRLGERARRSRTVLPAARDHAADGNQTGDIAITAAACVDARCARSRPVLLSRRRASGFSAPTRLRPAGRISGVETAVNARGDVLAVWVRNGVAYARMRTGGGRLQELRRLGSVRPNTRLSSDLGDARRAVVVFGGQGIDEGAATGPFVGYVSYAPPRREFGRRQRVEAVPTDGAGSYVAGPALAAAITSTGEVVVAWTGRDGGRYVVRTADARGRLRDARTLSDVSNDATLSGLATGPRGEIGILWTTGTRTSGSGPGSVSLVAALRLREGEAFRAAETIVEDERIDASGGHPLRFDPASGRVLTTWRVVGAPVAYSVRPPLSATGSTS